MPTLNIADLSLGIVWLFFAIRGYLRGLVKEVGSLAAIVTGFYCAGTYHKALAPHLSEYISGNYAGTAAYLLIFTVALIAVWFLALTISGIVKVTMTQWADRFFGGGFGLAKGVILTAVILFLIHLAAPHPDFLKGSVLVPVLEKVSTKLVRYIPPDINEKLRKLGRKSDKPEAEADRKTPPAAMAVPDRKPAGDARPAAPDKKIETPRPDAEKKQAEPAKAGAPKEQEKSTKPDPKRKEPASHDADRRQEKNAAPETSSKHPEGAKAGPDKKAKEPAKAAPERQQNPAAGADARHKGKPAAPDNDKKPAETPRQQAGNAAT